MGPHSHADVADVKPPIREQLVMVGASAIHPTSAPIGPPECSARVVRVLRHGDNPLAEQACAELIRTARAAAGG